MRKKAYGKLFIIIFFIAAMILAGMLIEKRNSEYRSYFVTPQTSEQIGSDASREVSAVLHVNINSDDPNELTQLNGIGEKMAQRIIDYRHEYGDFEVIEDIMRVPGIGTKRFDSFKNYIYIK